MNPIIALILISIPIVFMRIAAEMLKNKTENLNRELRLIKRDNWIVSKKDLYNLPSWEFDKWCASLLSKMGYDDMKIISEHIDGGKDIICTKDDSIAYIECIQKSAADGKIDRDECYEKVGRPDIQKFVGNMLHDNIKDGIVLTTGYFSTEANEYVKSLPEDFNVQTMDGDSLSMKHLQLIKNNA